jgi:signal transduction histidine kinase/CheY-like chemotaxis protein
MQGKMAEFQGQPIVSVDGAARAAVMSDLVSSFDWSSTPLGPAVEWPDSLKAVVRILLTSRFQMWMAWGPKLVCIYNDAYWQTTLGKKHPWALGRPIREVWPEIWNDIGPRIQRVLDTGEASWDEALFLLLERNGYPEETYHTFSYSPLAGSDGQISGMLCVVIEDTARVIGERQLAALRVLSSELGTAITERDVLTVLERALQIDERDLPFTLTYLCEAGTSRLKLVCLTGIAADHPAAAAEIDPRSMTAPWPVQQVLETRSALTVDDLAQRFIDLPPSIWNRSPVSARIVPIARQGQDELAGVLITALNPYRQLNADYAGFLDLVAGQIAAGIANARAYEEERKRAEALAQLDRAKTAFFSNVSHELRTPLTLMLGPIEDALHSRTPPSSESLEMLHRNALRLLKLVNALLDFARIEAGRLRASYQPTDLSLLTAEFASVFRSAIERAGLKLIVECQPLPEPVFVDREMWEKVVLNLLSNALKSTFEGEIRISLRSTPEGAELSVADTGTGIAAGDQPKLFERFIRIEGARRRSHEGSGIGLALVRELVEMHGGSIRVESTLGRGSTFIATLPFGNAHLTQGQVRLESSGQPNVPDSAAAYVREAMTWIPLQTSLGHGLDQSTAADTSHLQEVTEPGESKPTILLAEDNADMREYVRGLLVQRFKVVAVENGVSALNHATHRRPDLVLTDVMMPDMDGFALVSALRQHPSTRTLPIIMLSARAGEEARIEGIEASADDYITKPFTARELIARIEAHLKMAKLRREAQEHEDTLTSEVRRVQQLASDALEHIPDAFFMYDREFRITYMNPAAEEITRRLEQPHLGQRLWDLYPSAVGTLVETNFRWTMEQRAPTEFEYYYSPWERWYENRVYPQPGEGIIVYVRDTTESRKTEHVLRRSEQLAAAGRLAVSISHEINNPLEALTNLLYLAKLDEGLSGKARDLLQIADKELQRLSHIAARSLKFYKQRTAPTNASVDEILESVLFFHETRIKSKNIQVERRYRDAPSVFCFAGEIQQVFTNLISNALDALPDRERLLVSVRPSTGKGLSLGVRITIADSGCGMDGYTAERLFHPFFTTKGEAGTGLGLWVSKGILENHRAMFKVRSKPGHGTVFQLFFPLDSIPTHSSSVDPPRESHKWAPQN